MNMKTVTALGLSILFLFFITLSAWGIPLYINPNAEDAQCPSEVIWYSMNGTTEECYFTWSVTGGNFVGGSSNNTGPSVQVTWDDLPGPGN